MSNAVPPILDISIFPPGGWEFFQPETGWRTAGQSFSVTVGLIIEHRKGNPRHELSTDPGEVARQLAVFNCAKINYDSRYCAQAQSSQPEGVNNSTGVLTPVVQQPKCKTCGQK